MKIKTEKQTHSDLNVIVFLFSFFLCHRLFLFLSSSFYVPSKWY